VPVRTQQPISKPRNSCICKVNKEFPVGLIVYLCMLSPDFSRLFGVGVNNSEFGFWISLDMSAKN